MLNYRYPGVKPFQTSESSLFFGRETDIQDLYDLILVEKLVVLFGKSGYGKSSLIHAGLLPKLTHPKLHRNRPFIPLLIRFGSHSADNLHTPTQKVIEKLTQICPQDSHILFEKIWEKSNISEKTLWYYFKRIQEPKPQKFVLIFDQFEEFFTYPLQQQIEFRQQIAELLYTEIPQNIRNEWDSLIDEEKLYLSEDIVIKTLFSIREDRLSWLNTLKNELPAILHKRFELKGLNLAQAEAAIVRPAALPMSAGFASPPFVYEPSALSKILEALQASHAQNTPSVIHLQKATIEAFLLQICCENIEKKIIEQHKNTPSVAAQNQPIWVTINDLPNFEKIYEDYYYHKIKELPSGLQNIAKYVIEEELIIEDNNTNSYFRTTADERKLLEKYHAQGLTPNLLRLMVDAFLLRAEQNVFGFFNYEISHDTLLAPILKSKKQRKEAERIQIMQQRQMEAQAKAEAERSRREEAERLHAITRKTLKINKIIATFLALALVAMVFLWQFANYKKQEAQCQQYTFESLLTNEFDRTKALHLLKQAHDINPDTTFGKIYTILSDTFNAAFNPYYAATFEAHQNILTDVKISDDQKHILTASKDKTLKMWDLQGNLLKNFIGHQQKIMNVIFLDNQHFLSASEDATLKIWNIQTTTPLHSFFENIAQKDGYAIALALSPLKNRIAIATQKRVAFLPFNNDFSNVQNIFDEKKLLYLVDTEGYDQVCAMTFSNNGVMLATSHLDQKIRIWRSDNGKLIKTLDMPNLYKSLTFSPDNEFVYAGGDDAQICRLSVKNNNMITWKAHENYVLSLHFLPNSNILLSGSADKTIKMWQCEPLTTSPSVQAIFKGHNGEITQIAVSNDASFFVSASTDYKARLWNYKYSTSKSIEKEQLIDTIFASNQKYQIFVRSGTNILHLKRQGQTHFEIIKLPFLVNDVAIAQQKNYVAFKHLNNIVTLWDLAHESSIQKLVFAEPLLEKVGLSEDAHYFFIYTKKNEVIKIPTAVYYLSLE